MRRPEELEADLEAGRLADVYVLVGPAEYLIDRFAARLAEVADARRVLVDAADCPPERLGLEHLTADLFSTPKVVHVRGANGWKPKARKDLLKEVVERGLPPGTRLVLSWPATRPPKDPAPKGAAAAFFWNPFPSALPRLAEAWIRQHGGRAARGVGDELAERYGSDLRRMDQEARKLAWGCEGTVRVGDVDELCPRTEESRGFVVAQAATRGDLVEALASLEEVARGDGPFAVLAMLTNRLRRLVALRGLLDDDPRQGRDAVRAARRLAENPRMRRNQKADLEADIQGLLDSDAAADYPDLAGLKVWQASSLVADADAHPTEALATALRRCAEADRYLKGQGGDPVLALERVLLALRPQGRTHRKPAGLSARPRPPWRGPAAR